VYSTGRRVSVVIIACVDVGVWCFFCAALICGADAHAVPWHSCVMFCALCTREKNDVPGAPAAACYLLHGFAASGH
jgi:hypothetical protein